MRLFGKDPKRSEKTEDTDEYILRKDLQGEVETLQGQFREKQAELAEVSEKLEKVKEEYDTAVTNLMAVKKETNQKKMELDVVKREYRNIKSKILAGRESAGRTLNPETGKAETDLVTIKQKLEKAIKEYNEIKSTVSREQESLHAVKLQQIRVQKEMEETNARLYNARQELSRMQSGTEGESSDVLSSAEKKLFAQTAKSKSNGIIEAASAVVGSLKSKLSIVEGELETARQLLEKEKQDHEKTKNKLMEFRKKNQSNT